ncbi:hypothetical protein NUKP18_24410 [Klebsiella variicola]|nr:hypothetical protein NUKP18_24410 [Klebsiella variicola]
MRAQPVTLFNDYSWLAVDKATKKGGGYRLRMTPYKLHSRLGRYMFIKEFGSGKASHTRRVGF